MSIPINDIIPYLPEDSQIVCNNPQARILSLCPLADASGGIRSDYLYFGKLNSLGRLEELDRANLLIYYPERIPIDSFRTESNVLVIHSMESYADIRKNVSKMLSVESELNDVYNNMLSIVQLGGNFKKLLEYGYGILNNPLMLVDVSFAYITSLGTSTLVDEPCWEYAIKNKILPSGYISGIMENYYATHQNGEMTQTEFLTEPSSKHLTKHTQVSIKIIRNNYVIGYLKILELNRKITNYDRQVFMLLGRFISLLHSETEQSLYYAPPQMERFFTSILKQNITCAEEIETRQKYFGVKLYRHLFIISVRRREVPIGNDYLFYVLHKFKDLFPTNIVTLLENDCIILYDVRDLEDAFNAAMVDQLTAALNELGCVADISLPFEHLSDAYAYYRQTLDSAALRPVLGDCPVMQKYQDIFEYHMIVSLGKTIDLATLIHPIVRKLQEVDSQNGSNLLQTLFIYVSMRCDISAAAKAMFLHYNTMKSRISRIEELTGFSVENERELFQIALSERIIKILNRSSPN